MVERTCFNHIELLAPFTLARFWLLARLVMPEIY
jgi:hypothetical protein